MKNFKQYLEEASNARRIRRLGNRVEKGGSLQPGQAEAILRQASADPNLGGNNAEARMLGNMNRRDHNYAPPRIATKDALGNVMRRAGGLIKIYRGMSDAERGPGAAALVARHGGVDEMAKLVRPGGPTDAQRRAVKALKKQNQALRKKVNEMKMDPNPRPIDWKTVNGPGPRPTSPPITGWPPIDPKYTPKPGQRPSKTRGGNPNKPDKGGNHPEQHPNHPMYEDSGERGGSPEDGNTGYGLPRKNSRFYPAKNPRPTGPGTEYHMETLRQKYEAKKAAEAAAAAAEAAKSAGEQEPEHWRDFPTDVRYDQYGDQD